MSDEELEPKRGSGDPYLLIGVGLVIFTFVWWGYIFSKPSKKDAEIHENYALTGDSFGGLTSLSFLAIIYTLKLQREDLNLQRRELRLSLRELKTQSKTLKALTEPHFEASLKPLQPIEKDVRVYDVKNDGAAVEVLEVHTRPEDVIQMALTENADSTLHIRILDHERFNNGDARVIFKYQTALGVEKQEYWMTNGQKALRKLS